MLTIWDRYKFKYLGHSVKMCAEKKTEFSFLSLRRNKIFLKVLPLPSHHPLPYMEKYLFQIRGLLVRIL